MIKLQWMTVAVMGKAGWELPKTWKKKVASGKYIKLDCNEIFVIFLKNIEQKIRPERIIWKSIERQILCFAYFVYSALPHIHWATTESIERKSLKLNWVGRGVFIAFHCWYYSGCSRIWAYIMKTVFHIRLGRVLGDHSSLIIHWIMERVW